MKKIIMKIVTLCLVSCLILCGCGAPTTESVRNDISEVYEQVKNYGDIILTVWYDSLTNTSLDKGKRVLYTDIEGGALFNLEFISSYTGVSTDKISQFLVDEFGYNDYRAVNVHSSRVYDRTWDITDLTITGNYMYDDLKAVEIFYDGLGVTADINNKFNTITADLQKLSNSDNSSALTMKKTLSEIQEYKQYCDDIIDACCSPTSPRWNEMTRSSYISKKEVISEYQDKIEN